MKRTLRPLRLSWREMDDLYDLFFIVNDCSVCKSTIKINKMKDSIDSIFKKVERITLSELMSWRLK
jgi:hypothetical protein